MNNITKKIIEEAISDKTSAIESLKVFMIGVRLTYTIIEERIKRIKEIEKDIKELRKNLKEYN